MMETQPPSSTSNFSKFRLLMWKNYLLQWRHKVQAVVEILIPVLLCGILVLIRNLVDPQTVDKQTLFYPFRVSNLDDLRYVYIYSDFDRILKNFNLFYTWTMQKISKSAEPSIGWRMDTGLFAEKLFAWWIDWSCLCGSESGRMFRTRK